MCLMTVTISNSYFRSLYRTFKSFFRPLFSPPSIFLCFPPFPPSRPPSLFLFSLLYLPILPPLSSVYPCPSFFFFSSLRFLQVSSGYLVVVFVYVTEFTGIKVRTWTSMHVHAAFAVGIMVVALTGYLVRVWWIYQIILSVCTSPFLLFCWKFPETPFFLVAKGRYKDAQTLLDTIAQFNGLDYRLKVEDLLEPEERENSRALLEKPEERPSQSEKKLSILDLFGTWRMAGRTCTVWAIWFIGSLGYYVFSLGSVNLGGNQYINLFLAGK